MGWFTNNEDDYADTYGTDTEEQGQRVSDSLIHENEGGLRSRRATVMNRTEDAANNEADRTWGWL